jgi:hypothetical protein
MHYVATRAAAYVAKVGGGNMKVREIIMEKQT